MLQLKQFYNKAVRLNQQAFNEGQLLAHVAYDNYDFSLSIGKKILVGINKSNGDEIKSYLDVLSPYLYLPDQFMMQRFE